MEIVDVEENYAATIQRNDPPGSWARNKAATAGGSKLRLFITTTSSNLFERLNWPNLAIDLDFKVVSGQAIDKASLFVEDHHVSLDKVRKDAHYFILLWA